MRPLTKVRVACSAFWGLACVLLVVLWVRSYHYRSHYQRSFSATQLLVAESDVGRLYISWRVANYPRPRQGLTNEELNSEFVTLLQKMHASHEKLGFAIDRRIVPAEPRAGGTGVADIRGITLPYWFLTLLAALLPPVAWIKGTFSLRTLLIATTLVAVVLGLVVWLSR
jgi:hypothetical protein